MIPPGSRYEEADRSWVVGHVYDVYETPRMEDINPPTLRSI